MPTSFNIVELETFKTKKKGHNKKKVIVWEET
jgi:hypothetical protein